MARILITGAGGLLGANLVLAVAGGHEVLAVCGRHPIQLAGVETLSVDLTDESSSRGIVDAFRPDWIIHCAANTNLDECEKHPDAARRIHVDASRYLAEAARACGARMAYISTDAVYSGERGNYCEDEADSPVNVYAQTKLEGERAVMDVLPEALIARTTIYGWNMQAKRSLAEWALAELEAGRPIGGFTDAIFSPILVNDLADALLDAMERRLAGVYNIGGHDACSKWAFVVRLAEIFGLDSALITPKFLADAPFVAPRARNVSMRVDRIERALGRAMPGLDDGLLRFKALSETGYVDTLKALGGR